MRSLLCMVALFLISRCALFGFSGAGTIDSPYQIGTVSGQQTYPQAALPQGSPTQYYSFKLANAAAAQSTIGVVYPYASSGYTVSLYASGLSFTLLGTGSASYFSAGGAYYVLNAITASTTLAAGNYLLAITPKVNSARRSTVFSIHFVLDAVSSAGFHPINDSFAFPIGFPGTGGVRVGSNVGATKEPREPDHAGNPGGASVWYAWVAPGTGTTTVRTAGSSFDTLLAVYTYTPGSLNTVASNDDEGNGLVTSAVSFTAQGGVTYYIAVDGKNGATGRVVISLVEGGTPPYRPNNVAPADGVGDVSPNVTLTGVPYSQVDYTNAMQGSEWILRRVSNGSIYKTYYVGKAGNTLALTGLPYNTSFSWSVRYLDVRGAWSALSAPTAFTTATTWPPAVSINAVQAMAVRGLNGSTQQNGLIRITRTTSYTPLAVGYSVAGTASPGVDYSSIPGAVTFPAGTTEMEIPIEPTTTSSGKRNVILTLTSIQGYSMRQNTAAVSIRDAFFPQHLVCRSGSTFSIFESDQNTPLIAGTQEVTFGNGTEQVYAGDMDGDGLDDLILRSGTNFKVDTTLTGSADITFSCGPAKARCIIGDYDGDGRDDIILRSGNLFRVNTSHQTGAVSAFRFGNGTEQIVLKADRMHAGDWDGDGCDDLVLRSGNLFKIRSSRTGAVSRIRFGLPTDQVYLADMNGDGKIDLVLVRGDGIYRATLSHQGGAPDFTVAYGFPAEIATPIDFDGSAQLAQDVLMLRRNKTQFLINSEGTGYFAEFVFTLGTGAVHETYFPMRYQYRP